MYLHIFIYIDWFRLLIFSTNLVRGFSNKEMKCQKNRAILVQIALLLVSRPRNQNQARAYLYISIYIHVFVYVTYINITIYLYIYISVYYISLYIYIHTCMCLYYIHKYISIYLYVYICIYQHIFIYITYICISIYIHIIIYHIGSALGWVGIRFCTAGSHSSRYSLKKWNVINKISKNMVEYECPKRLDMTDFAVGGYD